MRDIIKGWQGFPAPLDFWSNHVGSYEQPIATTPYRLCLTDVAARGRLKISLSFPFPEDI